MPKIPDNVDSLEQKPKRDLAVSPENGLGMC